MAFKLDTLSDSPEVSKHAHLIYGEPKSGKTQFVGLGAKHPHVKRIIWFDLDNGSSALRDPRLAFTHEELSKFTIFRIPDTKTNPNAAETLLKALTTKSGVKICDAHGRVDCVDCKKAKSSETIFRLSDYGANDLIVIDHLKQLGDSCISLVMSSLPITAKTEWDHFWAQGAYLSAMLSVVQAAEYTNFVCITQALIHEEVVGSIKTPKIYPMCGTRNFSATVASYFSNVIYLDKYLKQHRAISSTTARSELSTGSRSSIDIQATKGGSFELFLNYIPKPPTL
jgi:hypothetical protein